MRSAPGFHPKSHANRTTQGLETLRGRPAAVPRPGGSRGVAHSMPPTAASSPPLRPAEAAMRPTTSAAAGATIGGARGACDAMRVGVLRTPHPKPPPPPRPYTHPIPHDTSPRHHTPPPPPHPPTHLPRLVCGGTATGAQPVNVSAQRAMDGGAATSPRRRPPPATMSAMPVVRVRAVRPQPITEGLDPNTPGPSAGSQPRHSPGPGHGAPPGSGAVHRRAPTCSRRRGPLRWPCPRRRRAGRAPP